MSTSVYICGITFSEPGNQHSRPCHSFHPLYFWPILLLSKLSHLQVTSSASSTAALIYHACASKRWPDPVVPIIYERSHGMWWKLRQWRFLMETRCHSETIRVPLAETVFKTWFGSLCILFAWPLCLHLKDYTHKSGNFLLKRAFISSWRFLHHPTLSLFMKVILASLTPITEEHTKLLDSLSEPSSQLIHRISHPPEEDVSAKVFTACFICVQVHSFASCIPTFCKRVSLSSQLPRNCLGSKLLSNPKSVLNYSPLQTMC